VNQSDLTVGLNTTRCFCFFLVLSVHGGSCGLSEVLRFCRRNWCIPVTTRRSILILPILGEAEELRLELQRKVFTSWQVRVHMVYMYVIKSSSLNVVSNCMSLFREPTQVDIWSIQGHSSPVFTTPPKPRWKMFMKSSDFESSSRRIHATGAILGKIFKRNCLYVAN